MDIWDTSENYELWAYVIVPCLIGLIALITLPFRKGSNYDR